MASSSAPSNGGNNGYDFSFKVLLIGDSGVGKSSLLMSFTTADLVAELPPTIGVDFKIKHVTVDGKRIKLTIWDTAGQERFRTLTSSYYRNAHGIVLVYDVTRRETFVNISDLWAKEVELYSTNLDCVKILVGNKVDEESRRSVTKDEGAALAEVLGCLFIECSARTRENVEQCFEGLISKPDRRRIKRQQEEDHIGAEPSQEIGAASSSSNASQLLLLNHTHDPNPSTSTP